MSDKSNIITSDYLFLCSVSGTIVILFLVLSALYVIGVRNNKDASYATFCIICAICLAFIAGTQL